MKEQTNFAFLWGETKGERGKLLAAVIFSALSTILTYAPFLVAYFILNELLQPNPRLQEVKSWAFIVAGLILLRFLFLGLSGVYSHIAAYNVLYQLRAKTVAHLGKLPLGYFTKTTSGDLKKTINEDIEKVENSLAHQLPDLSAAFIAQVVIFIYLLTVDWKLSLVLLLPLILSYGTQMLMFRNVKENMKLYHRHLVEMNSSFIEYIRGMAVFKAFNMTGASFQKLRQAILNYEKMWIKMTKEQSFLYSLFIVMTDAAPLFVIPVGGYRVLQGTLDVSAYLLFLILSMTFLSTLKQLLDLGRGLSMILEGVSRLKLIWSTPAQTVGNVKLRKEEVQSFRFDNVSFKYDEQYVLRNISLQVKRGETIAFVGPSGAGKSTAAELAARFFDIEEGAIYINNTRLQEMDQRSLMDNIAFVFQDTFLMDDTMWNNVSMGGDYSKEEIEHACKAAEIHEFIESLPKGYGTRLGEAGVKVSGGQKQRIAIARAILKDAPIIILDEATSHADVENERKIQKALDNLLQDKMVIIIAHRLHTIQHATRIYVFEDGCIIEEGTDEELIAQPGRYRSMWAAYTKFEEGGDLNVSKTATRL